MMNMQGSLSPCQDSEHVGDTLQGQPSVGMQGSAYRKARTLGPSMLLAGRRLSSGLVSG